MRQIEELERKPLYVSTSIKVVFPGRVVATMCLHPNETVQDLTNLVKSLLISLPLDNATGNGNDAAAAAAADSSGSSSSLPVVGFDLFTTPPRKSLPTTVVPSPTLTSLDLVPAAVVFVSWLKPKEQLGGDVVKGSQDCEHWFLNEKARAILEDTVANDRAPAFPTGISLTAQVVCPTQPKKNTHSYVYIFSRLSC
jgi:hypothetical protein